MGAGRQDVSAGARLQACACSWPQDNSNYSNAYFAVARVSGPFASQYGTLESSWWEQVPHRPSTPPRPHAQRDWGFTIPFATLQAADHPLYPVRGRRVTADDSWSQLVAAELAGMAPWLPSPAQEGYTSVPLDTVLVFGDWQVAFDPVTGAVTTLALGGVQYADAAHPLGQFVYRMYNQTDIDTFLNTYLTSQVRHQHVHAQLTHCSRRPVCACMAFIVLTSCRTRVGVPRLCACRGAVMTLMSCRASRTARSRRICGCAPPLPRSGRSKRLTRCLSMHSTPST